MHPARSSAVGTQVCNPLRPLTNIPLNLRTALSPWTALEYCTDIPGVNNTWTCHAPESCGCEWNATDNLLVLAPRGCKEMGTNARLALHAPSTIAPFISLPSTIGGSTGYYSPTMVSNRSTWVSTAIDGCKEMILFCRDPHADLRLGRHSIGNHTTHDLSSGTNQHCRAQSRCLAVGVYCLGGV